MFSDIGKVGEKVMVSLESNGFILLGAPINIYMDFVGFLKSGIF